jgi:hypothetical protein
MRFANVNAAFFAALAVQQVVAENCWCGKEIFSLPAVDTLTRRDSGPAKRSPRDLTAPSTDPNNPANRCTRPMHQSIHKDLVGKPEYCLGDTTQQLCCDDCRERSAATDPMRMPSQHNI